MKKTFVKTLENGRFIVVNEKGENFYSKKCIEFFFKWEAEQYAQQNGLVGEEFDFQGDWVEIAEVKETKIVVRAGRGTATHAGTMIENKNGKSIHVGCGVKQHGQSAKGYIKNTGLRFERENITCKKCLERL
ncbi:hypothetical protein ABKP09_20025 [Peribacillus frigoritolerans]|uniref:hypothetical protein n=1 Tax=Peribacillus frigoritolerans TaxID=450367 RepID=UPI0032B6007B